MKDKEPTSLKVIAQSTRPYPSTPRAPPQTPRAGPCYFPQNVLAEDENMDQSLNYTPDPASPTLPSNTPTPHKIEFKVTTSKPPPASNITQSDLSNSIHAPNNPMVDQLMDASSTPPTACTQTAEEDAILVHLMLAEANRSVLSQNGVNYCATLPQFTPMPIGGFPRVHMAHSAQIFDHLDNKVLLSWFQKHLPFESLPLNHRAVEEQMPSPWDSWYTRSPRKRQISYSAKAYGHLQILPSKHFPSAAQTPQNSSSASPVSRHQTQTLLGKPS
ncbi:hypothetical protein EDB19DRAFT_1834934 [Suillus lakei]|nr:hypothetical protein EDB19DRAFT_1834934 [Suillus lakei]